jgi:hypothetical protein
MTVIPNPLPHKSLVSDEIFDALRGEPKRKASSTREKEKQGHFEQQYELVAVNAPARRYRLFLRRAASNPDVFSVGLTLIMPEGDWVLCRYNSGHHSHKNILEKQKIPPTFHQHLLTQRYIAAGLESKGYAVARSEYNSFESALALLVDECSVENVLKQNPQQLLFPS